MSNQKINFDSNCIGEARFSRLKYHSPKTYSPIKMARRVCPNEKVPEIKENSSDFEEESNEKRLIAKDPQVIISES